MNFWFSISLLTVIVAVVCFYPLLRKRNTSYNMNRDELNKALYFNRLQEIEQDAQQGLLEDPAQSKNELQQSLLEDIPAQQNAEQAESGRSFNKIWFASGLLSLAIIALLVYFKVGAWQSENMLGQAYEKLPHFYERLQEERSNPLTEEEMQQFAVALRLKLQKDPNDAPAWWLLGQIGMALNKPQLAYDSYAKAVQLQPDNHEYSIAYARILMFSEDATDKLKGQELLTSVLRKDHTNMQALSLLAFRYFENEEYKMAAVTWGIMLQLMPEDDPGRELLEKSIRSARDAQMALDEEQKKP